MQTSLKRKTPRQGGRGAGKTLMPRHQPRAEFGRLLLLPTPNNRDSRQKGGRMAAFGQSRIFGKLLVAFGCFATCRYINGPSHRSDIVIPPYCSSILYSYYINRYSNRYSSNSDFIRKEQYILYLRP